MEYKGCENASLKEIPSISGDECHRDIQEINDKSAKNFAREYIKTPRIYMCCKGYEIQITKDQYEDLKNNLC